MAPKHTEPSMPIIIDDYTVLPLHIPPTSSFPKSTTHYTYIKPHAPRVPDQDTPRSLFASNVPIDTTEDALRRLFATQLGGSRLARVNFEPAPPVRELGSLTSVTGRKRKRGSQAQQPVEEEEMNEKLRARLSLPQTWDRLLRPSGSGAVLVFVDRASAEGAFKAVKKAAKGGKKIVWDAQDSEAPLGSARYEAHERLRFPPKSQLQSSVNAYLSAFSALEKSVEQNRLRQRTVPDADGFITVTRGGRAGPARLEEAQAAKEKLEERDKKRVGEDFYRFQLREKRKDGERELKRKFEEDKKRLEKMRAKRGKIRPE